MNNLDFCGECGCSIKSGSGPQLCFNCRMSDYDQEENTTPSQTSGFAEDPLFIALMKTILGS